MTRDRKIVYSVSALIFAALLSCLFISGEASSKIAAACVLVPACFITLYFIKKRTTPSINKRTVLLILAVSAVLYVVLLYLSGLKFGFYKSRELTAYEIFRIILPTVLIIVSTEIIRCVILAQRLKAATLLVYLCGICADVLIYSRLAGIQIFTEFMEVFALYLLPGVTANLFYNYIAKRYGFLPNTAFRLITAVYAHFLPVVPDVPDALMAFVKILLPLILLVFIDSLFEKKKRRALKRKHRFRFVFYGVFFALMVSFVMIISCQFRFGALVVATESMTGAINKGDAIIYERYEGDELLEVGDVVVFKKYGAKIIHRITDVEKINGQVRYRTKGDANEGADSGYITESDIIGTVKFRVMYVGFPTLWARELFK